MRIAVAADHAGFPLKNGVIEEVRRCGYEPIDLGTDSTAAVDYPDFAKLVATGVARGEADRGLLVCGTGQGMAIAASTPAIVA